MAVSMPTPALRTIDEPTVTGAHPAYRSNAVPRQWWTPTPAGEAPVGSDKARWACVARQSGEKTAASDVDGRSTVAAAHADEGRIQLPDPRAAEMAAIRDYACAFIAVETAHQRREWSERDDVRASWLPSWTA